MFTGLIETVGRLADVRPGRGLSRLAVASPLPVEELTRGESVAINGVCLTVVGSEGDRFRVEAVAETLARTTLGGLRAGARVNLERALRVGDRLGGHWVQGHVDGTVRVSEVRRAGGDHRVWLDLPAPLRRYVALKGSVALDGVSLTVSGLAGERFEVALIPETLERTTLSALRPGDRLNVEVDLLARYLERLGTG
jgi:riboflavin synthase